MEEGISPAYVPLWFDLLAVFIAGISGSLLAIKNRFDPSGVLAITLVAALGGGIIRDVIISRGPPAAFENPDYLYVALGAAGVGFLFLRLISRVDRWFLPMDAAALGVYTLVGMEKGLSANLPVITAIMLGMITATGGGLVRDLISMEIPQVLRPGHLMLTASLVGACVYALLDGLGLTSYASAWIALGAIMVLRLGSQYFGWTTPEAGEIPDRMTVVGSRMLSSHRRVRISPLRFPRRFGGQQKYRKRPDADEGPPGDD